MLERLSFDNRIGRAAATGQFGARGNGYMVPLLAKTDFSFDARAGTIQDIPIATGVDSSAWVSAVLVVRIHARNAWTGTTPTLTVFADNILLIPEEPDVIFAGTSPASIAITGASPTAAGLLLAQFSTPIGPELRVRLNYTVAANQTSANTISLGIDLVGRPA